MKEMNLTEFRADLERVAQTYASDISADSDGKLDTSYECYVYEIDGRLVGYIYMGECGEWAFIDKFDQFDTCDEEGTQLHDADEYLDRVKALSPYKER